MMNATDQQIYDEALSWSIDAAVCESIVCQARYETASYTSAVFKDDNNCFGMHYAGQYGATASTLHFEDGEPFAHYATIEDSVADLVAWLNNREADGSFVVSSLVTPELYAQALHDSGYYTEGVSAYTSGMETYYSQIFAGTGGGGQPVASGGNSNLLYIAVAIGIALVLTNRN